MFRKGDHKVFEIMRFLLILFIIVWVGSQVSFIFSPLVVFINTIIFPVIISGVLYYLSQPLMRLMIDKWKIKKIFTIIILFIIMLAIPSIIGFLIGPVIQKQLTDFSSNLPIIMYDLKQKLIELESSGKLSMISSYVNVDEIIAYGNELLKELLSRTGNVAFDIIGRVTDITLLLLVVPFMLFYMLKDGDKFPDTVLSLLKSKHKDEGKKILTEMNDQLSSYVQGQFIVAVSVGIMLLIGYLLVGLEYAVLLAFIAFALNFVPYLGPLIGTTPALIVALLHSPGLAIKVLIIILVAQQIEGNIISPQVMGKKLNIHPLTIIILLLVAGKFLGMVGMILALPFYVVVRVVFVNSMRLWKLRNNNNSSNSNIS